MRGRSGFGTGAIFRGGMIDFTDFTDRARLDKQIHQQYVQDAREIKLRVYAGDVIAIGPGKADLLAAIASTGSISGAGRALGMSYRRCWELVTIMNSQFIEPLVLSAKGGSNGGGTELSPLGKDVLKRYRTMERRAAKAIASDILHMRSLLRP